ncbi:MAG: hypothetical protein AVDCRST_MAG29-1581, partial [uncultured Nocardioidaceae bacterium]
ESRPVRAGEPSGSRRRSGPSRAGPRGEWPHGQADGSAGTGPGAPGRRPDPAPGAVPATPRPAARDRRGRYRPRHHRRGCRTVRRRHLRDRRRVHAPPGRGLLRQRRLGGRRDGPARAAAAGGGHLDVGRAGELVPGPVPRRPRADTAAAAGRRSHRLRRHGTDGGGHPCYRPRLDHRAAARADQPDRHRVRGRRDPRRRHAVRAERPRRLPAGPARLRPLRAADRGGGQPRRPGQRPADVPRGGPQAL